MLIIFGMKKKKTVSSRTIIKTLNQFKNKYNVNEFDFYTAYPREVFWILNKPVNSIAPELYKTINPQHSSNFVFFGDRSHFDFIIKSMNSKKKYKLSKNLLNNNQKGLSIWLIETTD